MLVRPLLGIGPKPTGCIPVGYIPTSHTHHFFYLTLRIDNPKNRYMYVLTRACLNYLNHLINLLYRRFIFNHFF